MAANEQAWQARSQGTICTKLSTVPVAKEVGARASNQKKEEEREKKRNQGALMWTGCLA